MELTERNVKVARRIVDIMAEEKCTVADAPDILRFSRRVRNFPELLCKG